MMLMVPTDDVGSRYSRTHVMTRARSSVDGLVGYSPRQIFGVNNEKNGMSSRAFEQKGRHFGIDIENGIFF